VKEDGISDLDKAFIRAERTVLDLLLHRTSRWSPAYRMAARLAPGIAAGRVEVRAA
jgi:hypothetical protein